jgi:AcrR family transcriptional regulator
VSAAVDVLRHEGFAAATARTIAARAGLNQALVFYHFGSVMDLLLAALDAVSMERRRRYEELLAAVDDPVVLAEMVAGVSSTPGLGAEVKARVMPWTELAAGAVRSAVAASPLASVVDPDEVAYVVVALYVGLEMLSHLDGDRSAARAVFERARTLAPLARLVAGGAAH